jgi:endoglucanase
MRATKNKLKLARILPTKGGLKHMNPAQTLPNTLTKKTISVPVLKNTKFSKAQLIVFALIFGSLGAYALFHGNAATATANVFISPSGSDSGSNCIRFATPTTNPTANTVCSTMTKAITLAQPGDVIQLEPGSYGSLNVTRESGADNPKVVIRGDPNLVDQQNCVESQATFLSASPLCAHGNVLITGLIVCGHGVSVQDVDTTSLSTTFYVGDNSCPDTNHVTNNHDIEIINSHFTYQSTLRGHDILMSHTRVGPNEQICNPSHNGADGDNVHIWPDAGTTPWTVPYNVTVDHSLIYDARLGDTSNAIQPHGCGWSAHTDLVQTLGYSNLTFTNNNLWGAVDAVWQDGTINGTTMSGNNVFENNFFGSSGIDGGLGNTGFGSGDSTCSTAHYTFRNNTRMGGINLDCPGASANNVFYGNYFSSVSASVSFTCGAGTYDYNVFGTTSNVTCGTHTKSCNPAFSYTPANNSSEANFSHGWDMHVSPTDACLKAAGNPSNFPVADFDADTRTSPPYAGADEFVTPGSGSAGITVSANNLLKDGQPFTMHGVNRSGTEFACIQGNGFFDGDNATSDDAQVPLMKSWGVNTVNIPINEDCWLGINGVPTAYRGTNYINAIKHYVATLEANGITPVVALFWTAPGTNQALDHDRMVDKDHGPALWQSIATTFKTDPYVVFRLKEEPHDIGDTVSSWQCLMLGDSQYDTSNTLVPVSNNSNCSGKTTFSALGMQSMINIVRGAGANNVIQVSGTEYGNSMTHFLDAGIRPTDPLSTDQLMAAVDVYPFDNTCGNITCANTYYAPVAAALPFVSGEVGEDTNCARTNMTEVDSFLNWLDSHNSGWMAWTWNAWGTQCDLINNYSTAPAHSPWGVDVKSRLLAYGGAASDTTPPSTPGTPSKSSSTLTSLTASWTASTDNVGVTSYNYYSNGSLAGSTASTSATLSGLTCGTSYTIAIEAVDAAGNKSPQSSASLSTNTCDTTAPTVSVTAPASGVTWSGATNAVNATAADTGGSNLAGVQFYLDYVGNPASNKLGAEDTASPYTTNLNTTTLANGTHTITAIARDGAGNTTTSSTISFTVNNASPPPPDTTAPSTPTGLSSPSKTTTTATITWNASTDTGTNPSGVAGYRIYKNGSGTALTSILVGSPLSYTDTGLTAGTTYTYKVSAYDNAGNESSQSTALSVTTNTNPAPTVSISASPTTISAGSSSTISWSSTNATTCTASGAWSGTKATSGTQVISMNSSSTFSLSCTGAGGAASASTTVTVTTATPPPAPAPKPGDCNSDNKVDVLDLSIVLAHYLQGATYSAGDLNNSGKVDVLDLSILLANFGK